MSLVLFSIVIFNLPVIEATFDVGLILTISTFLFGIISALVLQERYSRFEKIRELVAKETSSLTYMHGIVKGIDKKIGDRLLLLIDEYLRESCEYDFSEYQMKIEPYHQKIQTFMSSEIDGIRKGDRNYFTSALSSLKDLSDTRNEINLLGKDLLEKPQWITLLAISAITIMTTILSLGGNTVQRIIAVLFSSTILLIIFILRDLDNLSWKKDSLSGEPFRDAQENLGLLRFYLYEDIKNGAVWPPTNKEYRVGYHKAGSTEKSDIKIIKVGEKS